MGRPASALVLLLMCVANGASGAAATQAATTWRELKLAMLDYNQRTLVETYKAIGKRSAKWDEPALKLLGGMAVRFTNAFTTTRTRVEGDVPSAEMLAAGKAAMDAGCDDPQVMYCYAALLDDTHHDEEALVLLKRSLEAFPQSKYPTHRAFNAAARMLRHTKRDDPK